MESNNEEIKSIIADNLYNISDHKGHGLMPTDKCDEISEIILMELQKQFTITPIKDNVSEGWPKEWEPTKIDVKSGWKNRSKILSEITTAVNEETYVDDESQFMEKVDIILEWLRSKYVIHLQNK